MPNDKALLVYHSDAIILSSEHMPRRVSTFHLSRLLDVMATNKYQIKARGTVISNDTCY